MRVWVVVAALAFSACHKEEPKPTGSVCQSFTADSNEQKRTFHAYACSDGRSYSFECTRKITTGNFSCTCHGVSSQTFDALNPSTVDGSGSADVSSTNASCGWDLVKGP